MVLKKTRCKHTGILLKPKPGMKGIYFTNQVLKCQVLLFKFPWVKSSSALGNVFFAQEIFLEYETTI